MAVTTKILFPATSNSTTTDFSLSGLQLNNQDDLDVYVTKTTAGIAANNNKRILHFRQSTSSNVDANHNQVNNTDGLYFPAITHTGGTETLENYTLVNNNGTVRFNSALPSGAIVFVERRTRDADSAYTSFATGSTIRATDLNNSSTESNFTAQEARNKALTIEGVLFRGDQPSTNFVTSDHIVAGTIVTQDIANDAVNADKIADDVVNSEHYAAQSIDTEHIALENITTALIAGDAIVGSKIADNSIDSEHYVDGSIDREHLANDVIDGTKIADDAINSEHYANLSINAAHLNNNSVTTSKIENGAITDEKIAGGSLDNRYYTETELDAGQLDNRYFTETELTNGALDGRYFTETEADARYFNVSTGDTIKDGDTFPDNDTTIATTAAINDRIIDLVEEVGGFVPIANETSFPTANPDINNGTGTLVSIKSISSTRTPSSGTVTIANGAGSGNTVSITGCGSTVLTAGFGVIVETTSTLHTYAFHRLVPKATEVTTVAGKATEIGRLGTAAAVEDLSILGTADVVADLNTLGTADVVADMNMLATSDVISDMNTLAVTDVINDMDTVAGAVTNVNNVGGSIANVNTTAGSIANVNTVAGSIANVNTTAGSIANVNTTATNIASVNTTASNITDVNTFANRYRIASSDPSTNNDEGDLYFNTTSDELRVYNGSAWQGGVTATGNLAGLGTNTFTGNQTISNNNPTIIFTDGNENPDYNINVTSGEFFIKDTTAGVNKVIIGQNNTRILNNLDAESGLDVTGNITVSGNVDGRDVAADGSKLDGIASSSTANPNAIDNVVEDTSPQLGGDLDVQSNKITTATSNGNVKIEPNGTGVVEIRGAGGNDGTLQLNCSQQSHGIKLKSPAHSAGQSYTLTFPTSLTNNGVLTTNSSGTLSAGLLASANIADDAVGADQLANTSVTAGSYGSATAIPAITVDAQGRITAASTNAVNTTTNLSTSTATGSVTVNSSTGNNATISEATSSAAGVMSTAHHDKLDGIEAGATGDQTNAEIRAAVEAASDSNVFTDADHSKLNGIEASATADQTASEIRTLVESASDSNVFTDADHTKLNGIATSANNYSHPNHSGEVTSSGDGAMTIADNVVDEANLKVSNSPTNGYFLSAQSGNTGGLTWAEVDLTSLSASNLTSGTIPDARFPATLPAISGANLTGVASTTAGGAIYENSQTISTTHTIPSGSNGMSAGPVTVNNGVTLTISNGSTYTIV